MKKKKHCEYCDKDYTVNQYYKHCKSIKHVQAEKIQKLEKKIRNINKIIE